MSSTFDSVFDPVFLPDGVSSLRATVGRVVRYVDYTENTCLLTWLRDGMFLSPLLYSYLFA